MTLPASGAIAFSCINTELCRSSTAQLSMNCSSVRTLFGQASGAICMNTGHGKSNTSVPGAPTGVGGSASSSSAISVTFSAPASNGGLSIDLYQAISSPGCFTATAASSPISVTGLSAATAYTFRVRAHNSKGYGCYSSSSGTITTQASRGCAVYTTPGSYTWTAPAGVTCVSVLFIGAGGAGKPGVTYCNCGQYWRGSSGGGGGGAGWTNGYPTTPGSNYDVVVGAAASNSNGGLSSFLPYVAPRQYQASGGRGGSGTGCVQPTGGNNTTGYGKGGSGGASATFNYSQYINACGVLGGGGGGGAAATATIYNGGGYGGWGSAYSSGSPSPATTAGCAGTNGGAGGGGGGCSAQGGGGGGTGLYGVGSNGSSGTRGNNGNSGSGGGGGSGGNSGSGANGGSYGGGGGGGTYYFGSTSSIGSGANGAVRIVWPGNTRSWPSTDVGA